MVRQIEEHAFLTLLHNQLLHARAMKPKAVEVDDCMVKKLFYTNHHPETMGKH